MSLLDKYSTDGILKQQVVNVNSTFLVPKLFYNIKCPSARKTLYEGNVIFSAHIIVIQTLNFKKLKFKYILYKKYAFNFDFMILCLIAPSKSDLNKNDIIHESEALKRFVRTEKVEYKCISLNKIVSKFLSKVHKYRISSSKQF